MTLRDVPSSVIPVHLCIPCDRSSWQTRRTGKILHCPIPRLQLEMPALDSEKNGITLLLSRIKELEPERKKEILRALEQISSGESPQDREFLKFLKERHRIAVATLKAPARCPSGKEPAQLCHVLLGLFQGLEILYFDSFLRGNEKEAFRYLEQGLVWSDLIRKGDPTLLEATFGHVGWQMMFNCAFQGWAISRDQKAGLQEIKRLFNAHRIQRSEYAAIVKREAQYWSDGGGTRGILLDLDPEETMKFALQGPFADLTVAEALQLPYDEKEEIRGYEEHALNSLKHLQNNSPLELWPDFTRVPVQRTLEDYRKAPNGLGDLFRDQLNNVSSEVIAGNFFKDPAVETCIAWLTAEGEGLRFLPSSPGIGLDPIDGKLLRIDPGKRSIKRHRDPSKNGRRRSGR